VDHTPPNMDVPHHMDDTRIEDTDPPPTVERESHKVHSNAHSETAYQQHQQNQMEQDTDITKEDAVHNATTRENRELRHQSNAYKHEHIEQTDRQTTLTIAATRETRL